MSKLSIVILVGIFFSSALNAQNLPDEDVLTSDDSLIYPVYDYDYYPDVTYEEIKVRLSLLENTVPLELNSRVKAFIDYFTIKDREYTREVLGKRHIYFPIFEKILKENNLPDELKYLSIVESGLNPKAQSRVGAIGLWQFMYGTARAYGLKIDWYIDERMDPVKSTQAACQYMKALYHEFEDWELALAAYNCGPGNVRKAIRRSGYKRKFWEIYRYLPRETRSYLPQYVAMVYVNNHAADHNLYFDEHKIHFPASDTILVNHFLYIRTLADLTGLCPEDIENLNPMIKRRAVPDTEKDFVLYLPADIKPYLNDHRDYILDSARNTGREELEYIARHEAGSTYGREKIIHIVRSGDALSLIAEKYKVRIEDIKIWNNLSSNLIRINQRLNIWVNQNFYIQNSRLSGIPPVTEKSLASNDKTHVVRPGDSLWKISQQYQGLTVEKIKQLNNLSGNKIIPGQILKIG